MRIIREDTRAHAFYDPGSQRLQVRLYSPAYDGQKIAAPIQYVDRVRNSSTPTQPTAYLDEQQAQELMDSLWDCGVRPAEGAGSAGQLVAVQRHLEDMRALYFAIAETPKP